MSRTIKRFHGCTGEYRGDFIHGTTLECPLEIAFDPDGHLYLAQRQRPH